MIVEVRNRTQSYCLEGKGAAEVDFLCPFFKNNPKGVNMEFRPCIDIHNGRVKQIVGSSLKDLGNEAKENFVAEQDAAFFAELYRKQNIRGGHIILLNSRDSEYYEATKRQALLALAAGRGVELAFPAGGLALFLGSGAARRRGGQALRAELGI